MSSCSAFLSESCVCSVLISSQYFLFTYRLLGFSKCAESPSIGIFEIDRLSDSSEAKLLVADSNGLNVTPLGAYLGRQHVCFVCKQTGDPPSRLAHSFLDNGFPLPLIQEEQIVRNRVVKQPTVPI